MECGRSRCLPGRFPVVGQELNLSVTPRVMRNMVDTEVVVIGAGLAGLRCASVLAAAGRDVTVWEADDDVGGRVRTDTIDGFRCDRGFQVLNPAYPELTRAVDVPALRLQPFAAGVMVRRAHDSTEWVHPLREPRRVLTMLTAGGIGPQALLALSRWAAPALRPAKIKALGQHDVSLRQALDRSRVRGELRRVIDRFFAGVLLDDAGDSSNGFALLLARMFLLGVPALPADGMQALPRQLAEQLSDRITLNRKVLGVRGEPGAWTISSNDATTTSRHVVVATDPVAATSLTGETAAPLHAVVTDWWATSQAPPGPPMLRVDGRPDPPGPVLNTAVISAAAPSYAPPGRHLIVASALLTPAGTAPPEAETRRHAADILHTGGRDWSLLTRHVIRHALPEQQPPLNICRAARTPAGIWLCGDHRDTASIQGAVVSGRRIAHAILQDH